MTTFHAVQGDLKDVAIVQLDGVNDFTGATAAATVWKKSGVTTPLTGAVVNAVDVNGVACGRATLQYDTWLATALGSYRLRTTVTFNDGTKLTWPATGWDEIVVTLTGT